MKKPVVVIALLAVCLFSLSASPQTKTQAWEYKTEDRCFEEKRMNALGSEGWDLAGFSETDRGAWHCVFKRPKN